MKIQESAENYLESIYTLGKRKNPVRAVDIANELGFSKPSVSVALKNLRAGGYLETDTDGAIQLTEMGLKIAQSMYARHTLIADWLIYLGVVPKTAVQDACKMEHAMSEESFAAIKEHIDTWKSDVYRSKANKKST